MNLQTACKYFGCQIEVNGEIHTMWGIAPTGVWYTGSNNIRKVAKWGEWNPILKELRDITDEDAVEVAEFMGFGKDPFAKHRVQRLLCQEYGDVGYFKPIREYRDVIDFLRSRYYDIDNVLNTVP